MKKRIGKRLVHHENNKYLVLEDTVIIRKTYFCHKQSFDHPGTKKCRGKTLILLDINMT